MLLELVSIHSVAKAIKQNYLISPLYDYIFSASAMILINFFPNDCQKSYPRILCHIKNKWKYAKYTVFDSYLPSRNTGILLQRAWHLISDNVTLQFKFRHVAMWRHMNLVITCCLYGPLWLICTLLTDLLWVTNFMKSIF